jgi:hypothetical protein
MTVEIDVRRMNTKVTLVASVRFGTVHQTMTFHAATYRDAMGMFHEWMLTYSL